MRASQLLISTLKEAPKEAEIISHKLMLRAGLIRQVAAGMYTFLPLGFRVLHKIMHIIRTEMNQSGAAEVLMPMVQPAELWRQSGRYDKYGDLLLRFQDRHERDFVLQPTSEEVVTSLAAAEIKSKRQLPLNLYHIQTKFRDERRPRFGIMRSREFIMKDAYSFDIDHAGLEKAYQNMLQTYQRIFHKLHLRFRMVDADNGEIGGTRSQEFHVLANTGEDALAYCENSDFAANIEAAPAVSALASRATPQQPLEKTLTPNCTKCETVVKMLKQPITQSVKSIVIAVEQENQEGADKVSLVMLLLRADHQLNEVKVSKITGLSTFRLASREEIEAVFNCVPGYLGPLEMAEKVRIIADKTVADMSDFICGANVAEYHYTGVNWLRDAPLPEVCDIRNVEVGDPSPCGQGTLNIERGIEVGHIFALGDSYARAMGATLLDDKGELQPLQMGCYGIGISRIIGAAIEQNYDEKGIVWPLPIAPFSVVLCVIGADKSEAVKEAAEACYQALQENAIDVIYDDRGLRPGVMFADWELIGIPLRITISERTLKDNAAELHVRKSGALEMVPLDRLVQKCGEGS